MAGLVKVDPTEFAKYAFDNRSAKRHRTQIREALGFRPATEDDQQRWTEWVATEQCPVEQDRGRLQAALRQRCRSEGVEPRHRGADRAGDRRALRRHETTFAAEIVRRLGPGGCTSLQALLESEGALAEVKADPGPLGLDTLMGEIIVSGQRIGMLLINSQLTQFVDAMSAITALAVIRTRSATSTSSV